MSRANRKPPVQKPRSPSSPQTPTWQQKSLHYLGAPFRFVQRQIDPKYVLSMMDPRAILFPLTLRKVALWIVYGGVIAMYYLLDRYYHWWHRLDRAVHGKNLYIMGVLYGFEPLMIVIIMAVARVPDARKVPDRTVLVPRGTDSMEVSDDEESMHGSSDDESVASAEMAAQLHSTILEEEHDEENSVDGEMQSRDKGVDAGARRTSAMLAPSMRRLSARPATASGLLTVPGERRGSGATTDSGLLPCPGRLLRSTQPKEHDHSARASHRRQHWDSA